ncbi:MAG TPA: aldehyde dehydrogenase family protein [Vicinamibacteria bacterium]|nr:aldehyde dehydrogenase family protein [Vicinamibacteria bacterium]
MVTAAAPAALETRHSWVGNREVVGRGGIRAAVNPATGDAFAAASLLDAEQAKEAVAAARSAAAAWGGLDFRTRGQVLLAARDILAAEADELARLIASEQGKPVAEALAADVFPSLEALRHLALHAERSLRQEAMESEVPLFVHKDASLAFEPFGVVLVITPWNYPLFLAMSAAATALAAGNAVVLKPAPSTTLVGLKIGDIFRRAGLPEGVLAVVAVDDRVAAGLVEDSRIGKIAFIGSVATGQKIMAAAARNLIPVLLELGGKDAAIVCRDADIDRAAQGIVWGAFMNTGQTCVSVERVYVEAPVAEAFVARVVEETRRLRVGDPLRPETDVGPLTLERQRAVVEEHVKDAVARGARVITGGARPPGRGHFYPPTVLTGVDHTMRIMREETFGPVLPIRAVKDVDEAIALANDSEYGLTASGWTRDRKLAARLQRELRAGVVTINDCVSSIGEPTAPYGGFGKSGIGRSHGALGLREMVRSKYVTWDGARRAAAWWFPYGEGFAGFMRSAVPAIHGSGLARRLGAQLRLLACSRFWRGVNVFALLRRLDRFVS